MDNIQAIYAYNLTTKSGKKWCAKLLAEAEQWAAEQGSNKKSVHFANEAVASHEVVIHQFS